jgi:hypothetical protein
MADIVVRRDGNLPPEMKFRFRDLGNGIYAEEYYIVGGAIVATVDGAVDTNQTNGVPNTYTNLTSNGIEFLVSKGQLNKLRLRPQILNEHAESSREVQGTVNASTIVGQVFKASQDNINGLMLTLESAAGVTLDDFESYADSAALQLVWVKGGTNEALLETAIVESGSKSMNLPLGILNDDWVDTISSTDYTGTTFEFDYYQDVPFSLAKVAFFIGDGANTKALQLPINATAQWIHFSIDETSMVEDGATTDVSAITKIGFRVDDRQPNADGYVDNLTATAAPGSISLKLWDMGTSIPVSATTSIDDGTQFTQLGDIGFTAPAAAITLPLEGGKRLYVVKNFVAGVALEIPSNTVLTVGNYYLVTLNYVDTNVDVFGPDTSFLTDYYTSGYAFTAPNESTAITAVGPYSDLMFGILSTQDVYLTGFFQFIDAIPGNNSLVNIFVEDLNMAITDIITIGVRAAQEIEADISIRPMPMEKGGKFELYYNDDATDSVSGIGLSMAYLYVPPTVNG